MSETDRRIHELERELAELKSRQRYGDDEEDGEDVTWEEFRAMPFERKLQVSDGARRRMYQEHAERLTQGG